MTTIKTAELTGVELDYAVAMCGEWKTAHEHFPTWTLDATFKGARIVTFGDGRRECILTPNNPMRQDPQTYDPSTNWALGGPIIERGQLELRKEPRWQDKVDVWQVGERGSLEGSGIGASFCGNCMEHESLLVAAMRCYVKAILGDTVEIPEAP